MSRLPSDPLLPTLDPGVFWTFPAQHGWSRPQPSREFSPPFFFVFFLISFKDVRVRSALCPLLGLSFKVPGFSRFFLPVLRSFLFVFYVPALFFCHFFRPRTTFGSGFCLGGRRRRSSANPHGAFFFSFFFPSPLMRLGTPYFLRRSTSTVAFSFFAFFFVPLPPTASIVFPFFLPVPAPLPDFFRAGEGEAGGTPQPRPFQSLR